MVLNEFVNSDEEVVAVSLISVKTPSGHSYSTKSKDANEEDVVASPTSART